MIRLLIWWPILLLRIIQRAITYCTFCKLDELAITFTYVYITSNICNNTHHGITYTSPHCGVATVKSRSEVSTSFFGCVV